jgi:hypothetical protein
VDAGVLWAAPLAAAGGALAEVQMLAGGGGGGRRRPGPNLSQGAGAGLLRAGTTCLLPVQQSQMWRRPGFPAAAVAPPVVGWRSVQADARYLAGGNWPVRHAAVSADGGQLAVAGRRGLAVYSAGRGQWRLFGDVTQERRVRCVGLRWWRHSVVAYAAAVPGAAEGEPGVAAAGPHVLILPSRHLDFDSLLQPPLPLPAPPVAADVEEGQGLLLTACAGGQLLVHQLWPASGEAGEGDDAQLRAITLRCRLELGVAGPVAARLVPVHCLPPAPPEPTGGWSGLARGGAGPFGDGPPAWRAVTPALWTCAGAGVEACSLAGLAAAVVAVAAGGTVPAGCFECWATFDAEVGWARSSAKRCPPMLSIFQRWRH